MRSHTLNNVNKPAAAPPAAADLIGSIIGDFGIWQLRTVLIIFLCKIPASWFMACIIYTAPELYPGSEFECDFDASTNATVTLDQCAIVTDDSQQECSSFKYNYDFYSLIMQFNLVCNRDILVAWTQFWHLFGILVGGVIATKMMLWISPRTTSFIGMVLQIICGCVTGFARDFSLHCAFRCLSAACCALMFTAGQTIYITAGNYRLGAVILYDTFWSIGLFLLPGLASFFHNWTEIYLGITFPTLALILLLNWTPESPRWLLRNGKDIKQVEDIIREGAEINDRTYKIPPDFTEQLRLQSESFKANPPKQATWLELWTGPRAKIHFIAAHIALSAFIINFMGMLLNVRSFGRDFLNVNTIIIGFSEIVGCFLALHFTLKHNRWKWQWAGGFNIVAGLIGFAGWAFSDSMDKNLLASLWIIIAAIPKAGVSLAQSMMVACLAELVSAHKKAPFMFSVVTFARVCLLTAPFVNVLKKIAVAMSLSAFCLLSIIGGICLCCLVTPRPPTANHSTQNGVTEVEHDITTTEITADVNKEVWTVEVYDNDIDIDTRL